VRKLLTITILATLSAGAAMAAGKTERRDYPSRYLPHSLDGEIVRVQSAVNGVAWSAWAYRNGSEYDLAVAVSFSPGVWSEPHLIGLDDGLNQARPAFATDGRGNIYLAYEAGNGALHVRGLRAGTLTWLPAVSIVDESGNAGSPALTVVGNALVVGYRTADRVGLATLPLLQPRVDGTASIYDGPDPIGARDEGDDDDDNDDSAQNGFSFEAHGGSTGGVILHPHEGGDSN